jgi:Flp pilus assembly protein TadD
MKRIVAVCVAVALAGAATLLVMSGLNRQGTTYRRDVEPIVFEHCVKCHHPGGSAPFSLTTYADVKKRAQLVAKVTAQRIMPPWLPEPGHGAFIGERRLSDEQIGKIAAWVKAGALHGTPANPGRKPSWSSDWQLGPPDLVVTMPESYTLPESGPDVYRNFVIPDAIPQDVYLRAIEFRPGNPAIHHAFIYFDAKGGARELDAREGELGFPGMDPGDGAQPANAMFCSWQPGRGAEEAPPGYSTPLKKGTDLVFQMHMRSTGKPEPIQPSVALYFTDKPPAGLSYLFLLRSVQIDIPAEASDYAIESSYQLPVDVKIISILPHMHYLGREAQGWAELPDGKRIELLLIKRWDFNWQTDFRYKSPVLLPKGTTVRMRFTYDNSSRNARNPNQPPKRVTYGLQSSDEMGELWFQLALRNPAELDQFHRDYSEKWSAPDAVARAEMMVKLNPGDSRERTKLARALVVMNRPDEAMRELEKVVTDDPAYADAYYVMGTIHTGRNDSVKAVKAFSRAVELNPNDAKARTNLGWVLLASGDAAAAIPHLEKAVEINPNDDLARRNLSRARNSVRQPQGFKPQP